MKSCMTCERINIGGNYDDVSPGRVLVGLPLVYLPIVFLPLFLLSAALTYTHLRFLGAQNLKGLGAFLPDWNSHRYDYKTQIVCPAGPKAAFWVRTRLFWLFNCTFYCPVSVAVLEWHTYLVKAVENWWCPFTHSRKDNYGSSKIDSSYWHTVGDQYLLHADDQTDPFWSERPTQNPAG